MGGASVGGEAGHGGLDGEEAQVQALFVGKYGMVFLGVRSSSAAHFLTKIGQLGEELACLDLAPHDTQDGALSWAQEKEEWLTLAQFAHFFTPTQASLV